MIAFEQPPSLDDKEEYEAWQMRMLVIIQNAVNDLNERLEKLEP